MKINSINNYRQNFGVRLQGGGLSMLKKICIDGGLSPQLYKKEMAKVQKIFPSSKDRLILNFLPSNPTEPFTTNYYFSIATSYKGFKHLEFTVPKNPKYTVAKFISACRELVQMCQK